MKRFAECCRLQKPGDTAAARRVRLLHVDCARFQHAAEVVERVAIFARGDFHAAGT